MNHPRSGGVRILGQQEYVQGCTMTVAAGSHNEAEYLTEFGLSVSRALVKRMDRIISVSSVSTAH